MKTPDELTPMFERITDGLALLEAVFARSPVATRISLPDGRAVLTNAAYHWIFGESNDLPADFTPALREAAEGRLSRLPAAWRIRGGLQPVATPDADAIAVSSVFYPIFSQDGRVAYVTAVFVDETNERRALRTLGESETKFRQLSESIGEVFWLTSKDSATIHYISPAYERIWGRSVESLYASPSQWAEAIHPDDRSDVLRKLADKPRGQYQAEYRIIRPDGTIRWIRDRGFPVLDDAGQVVRVAGIAMDITEQMSLSQQLQQAQKLEAVGRLAAGISHDFNNLLTAIMGYTQMLSLALPPEDEKQADVREIQQTAERASHLTHQLLAFSRQQVMRPATVAVNGLISDMRRMLDRLIGEDIRIVENLAPDVGLVRVDPIQLEQVLMNLFVNSRDAMPDGGTITITTANADVNEAEGRPGLEPGSYVRMTITDTGPGIPPEILPKIFEPFFTTKEKGKGTGLGLATAYGIIQQSGGGLFASSKSGEGARFDIFLPLLRDAVASARGHEAPSNDLKTGRGSVIVVEDEERVRRLTCRILGGCGYAVTEAASPAEALALLEKPEARFDLMLTDVILPGMSGKELSERVRKQLPQIKLLFMSGYANEVVARSHVLEEGLPFIEKPFTAAALTNKVSEVLRAG